MKMEDSTFEGAGQAKRPRSWGNLSELSHSLVEGVAGMVRAAKVGVTCMIMTLAEVDPFSEVSLPGNVHMMGMTYEISPPKTSPISSSSSSAPPASSTQVAEAMAASHAASTLLASATSTTSVGSSTLSSEGNRQFRIDMKSRLWFTYRHSMPPIVGSGGGTAAGLTSDAGWGCMLRSAQMMFAQALIVHALGRNWRLPDSPFQDLPPVYRTILSLFADHPKAPMSIHSIAKAGEEGGKKVGQWLGPNTVCAAFQRLHQRGSLDSIPGKESGDRLQLLLFDSTDGDNTIYRSDCKEALQHGPILVLVPVRLGTYTIDESYVPKVAAILGLPQSVGFIGGRPRSAHYFVAARGRLVYFLDPHTTQPYTPLGTEHEDARRHATWHCDVQRRMSLVDIDASLTFGFYCRDDGDFDLLCRSLDGVNAVMGGYPAVSTAQERGEEDSGTWDDECDDDTDLISFPIPSSSDGLEEEEKKEQE